MNAPLRILYAEGALNQHPAVERHLQSQGVLARWLLSTSPMRLRTALEEDDWDAVLLEYGAGNAGFDANLPVIQSWLERVPVILLARREQERQAADELERGFWDYVLLDDPTRLAATLNRASRTLRKRAQRWQALTVEVLQVLNDRRAPTDAAQSILEAIQRETGIEAAGIRLRQGNDFPYAVAMGLSEDFLQQENTLAARTPNGGFCLDAQGRVCLECTCGLVLSGKTDSANPFFTPGGSAWTNDARPFHDLAAEADPRFRPRNRCLHEGFQSVALVPIRVGKEIVGLLQLNDRRAGCFDRETIHWLEGLTSSLGIALQRMQEEAALRESEHSLVSLFDAIPESLFLMDLEARVLAANRGFAARFDKSVEDCVGRGLFELLPPSLVPLRQSWMTEVARTRQRLIHEELWGERWLRHHYCPILGPSGEVERIVVLALDITDRKRAEGELQASQQLLRTVVDLVPHFIFAKDRQSRHLLANRACAAASGMTPEEMVGRCDADFVADRAQAEAFMRDDREVIDSGQPKHVAEERLTDAAGQTRILQTAKIPFTFPGLGPALVGVAVDITERKRAEEEIRRQTSLINRLVDSIPDLIFFKDLHGVYLGCNPAFAEFVGRPRDQIVGRTDHALFGQEVADFFREQDRQMLVSLAPRQNEEWVAYPDGRRRLLNTLKTPYRDPGGELLGVLGVSRDVTERRQAEERLARTSRMLAEAQSIAHLGSFEYVAEDRSTVWSEEEYRIYGLDPHGPSPSYADLLAQHIHPDDAALLDRAFSAALRSGSVYELEHRIVRPDGSVRFVHDRAQPFFDEQGRLIRYVGATLDITERKRAQTALVESEERFRHLVETAFDWIWEVDASGRYTYSSPRVRDLLGYAPEEVLGRSPFEFMPEAEARRVGAFFRDFAAQRVSFSNLENTNLHRSGRPVVLETSGAPILDPAGRLVGYRGMDRDITEKKRLEAQLLQSQKLESIGQLSGGIAHDFNNILAAMMMQLSLARLNPALDPTMKQALDDLNGEAKRAANLTRQLLMFSRRSVLATKPLHVNEVVGDLLKMLTRLIGEHIVLRYDNTPPLPQVEADAGMMEQILVNLVVNARDAMPKGGNITIHTQRAVWAAEDAARNADRRPGQFVCLSVADTGCGMDAAALRRIFEPFFTTKEAGKGTGLGLATVHGIVAQHKGWVEVESQPGKGSTFRVYLPAIVASGQKADVNPSAEPIEGGKETLLLVEDEATLRRATGQLLGALGYRVLEAENGQKAMRLWQEYGQHVNLVLTDMVMPEGMTGLELAERLQAQKPDLKVVIASGYSSEIAKLGALSNEGIAFLPKPYEIDTLARVLRRCLDTPPSRRGEGGFGLPTAGATLGRAERSRDLRVSSEQGQGAIGALPPWPKERLSTVSLELRDRLRNAALRGRYRLLLDLTAEVAATDAEIGQRLRQLALRFDYPAILQLLDPSEL